MEEKRNNSNRANSNKANARKTNSNKAFRESYIDERSGFTVIQNKKVLNNKR